MMQISYDDGRPDKILEATSMNALFDLAVAEAKDPHVKKLVITIERTGNPKKNPNQRRKALRSKAEANND